uniref:Uncharacterized protein n=1 Tax=Anguilla anguilla TaxID=7936 RepID=A0A0E9VJN5_ANGAN
MDKHKHLHTPLTLSLSH